jgi:mRNA interferase RelE/StbE
MPEYRVEFEKRAQKALLKMARTQANIILAWINKNLVGTTDPRQSGKALSADYRGKWRYRVGDYRLIANISDETVTILVLEIGHREKIYQQRR